MNPVILYIYCSHDARHRDLAFQFVNSYLDFPPNCEHRTIVVCQTGRPDWSVDEMFGRLPGLSYYDHDDSGWDIGGYIAAAKTMSGVDSNCNDFADFVVCFGGTSFFAKSGWLLRMVEAWQKHGEGFYGGKATYEVSPHLNTCGFWTSPRLLANHPLKIVTKRDRYDFEHGPNAMWKTLNHQGYPCKYVTWTDELDWPDWRNPLNGFRRGDQSDCLTRWWLNNHYEQAAPGMKKTLQQSSDIITDPFFGHLMKPNVNPVVRSELIRKSMDRMNRIHKFK